MPKISRIFHCVDLFSDPDKASAARAAAMQRTWDDLLERGDIIPAYFHPPYPRNAQKTIGDPRKLPYLRDLFEKSMKQMDDDDMLLFTNSDNALSPLLPEYLKFHVGVFGACTIPRTEIRGKMPSLDLPPEQLAKLGAPRQVGRDGFAMTKAWLTDHWDEIPDCVLGASTWDILLAAMIRLDYGIKTNNSNLGERIFPADIPGGYILHQAHHSAWHTPDRDTVPSNAHNAALFKKFAARRLPELKVGEHGGIG
jgi:hypothetical protein